MQIAPVEDEKSLGALCLSLDPSHAMLKMTSSPPQEISQKILKPGTAEQAEMNPNLPKRRESGVLDPCLVKISLLNFPHVLTQNVKNRWPS